VQGLPQLQIPHALQQSSSNASDVQVGSPTAPAPQQGSLLQQALQASSQPPSPAAATASPAAAASALPPEGKSAPASPFAAAAASAGAAAWRAVPKPSPGGSPRSPTGGGDVVSYGSGPALAPRKPRAQRQVDMLQQAESRERRKSERRLSKGAQIAWSTCQIIESKELKLVSPIGSGAYGKVWTGIAGAVAGVKRTTEGFQMRLEWAEVPELCRVSWHGSTARGQQSSRLTAKGVCSYLIHDRLFNQVWLAEWMGTQVAAKELLCLTARAKDDASRKRHERRGSASGADGDTASDSGSDRWGSGAQLRLPALLCPYPLCLC
jgi:hypothetical protein